MEEKKLRRRRRFWRTCSRPYPVERDTRSGNDNRDDSDVEPDDGRTFPDPARLPAPDFYGRPSRRCLYLLRTRRAALVSASSAACGWRRIARCRCRSRTRSSGFRTGLGAGPGNQSSKFQRRSTGDPTPKAFAALKCLELWAQGLGRAGARVCLNGSSNCCHLGAFSF